MNSKLTEENLEMLYRAIVSLETVEECRRFFDDICTVVEVRDMAQRLQVAQMLEQKIIYADIVKLTGASTATISRINRCREYGSGGYRMVLERLKDGE